MTENTPPAKYKNKFEVSYENYLLGRFQPIVGLVRKFSTEIGEEKALKLASEFVEETARIQTKMAFKDTPIENFEQFKDVFKKFITSEFYTNSSSSTILEDSEKKLEFNFTECLWVDVMKKLGFDGDKGYKICCDADYAMASTMHPKVKLTRTKTLMQGHECCNHCYSWEE
jgi:hypothetical protein